MRAILAFLAIFALFGCAVENGENSENSDSRVIFQAKEYKIAQFFINGESLKVPNEATFGIENDKIYGNAGCNSYFANFVLINAKTAQISNSGATKMACMEREINRFEHEFLSQLEGIFEIRESSKNITIQGKTTRIVLEK